MENNWLLLENNKKKLKHKKKLKQMKKSPQSKVSSTESFTVSDKKLEQSIGNI